MALNLLGKATTAVLLVTSMFQANKAMAQSNTAAADNNLPVVQKTFNIAPDISGRHGLPASSTGYNQRNTYNNNVQNNIADNGLKILYDRSSGALHLEVNGAEVDDRGNETDLNIVMDTQRGAGPDYGKQDQELEIKKLVVDDYGYVTRMEFDVRNQYGATNEKAAFVVVPRGGQPYQMNTTFIFNGRVPVLDMKSRTPLSSGDAKNIKSETINGVKVNIPSLTLKNVFGEGQAIRQVIYPTANVK